MLLKTLGDELEVMRRRLAMLRKAFEGIDGVYSGVSALPNGCGVWARALAPDVRMSASSPR